MFIAPNKTEIYLTLDLTYIKTIMTSKEKKYIVYDKPETNEIKQQQFENVFSQVKEIPLQDKLIKLYQTEFKKHDRLEKKMSKEFTEYRFIKLVEVAELNLNIYKSKSKRIRDELSEKVRIIETTLSNNLLTLKKVQDDKRQISKALSSLLMV